MKYFFWHITPFCGWLWPPPRGGACEVCARACWSLNKRLWAPLPGKRTIVLIAQLWGEKRRGPLKSPRVYVCVRYPHRWRAGDEPWSRKAPWVMSRSHLHVVCGEGVVTAAEKWWSREGCAVLGSWFRELKWRAHPWSPFPLRSDPCVGVSRSSFRWFSRCCPSQCQLHPACQGQRLAFWVQFKLFNQGKEIASYNK